MREISCADISALVERLCIQAATVLPDDLCRVIEQAEKKEESPVGKGILQDIVTNFRMAREKGVPICQDTGMAVVFLEIGQEVHITGGSLNVAPKGFGSENMSAMRMFTPAASWQDIEDWIVSSVSTAGSNPCPPVIVGVGLGGTIEQCALEAKKALMMPMDTPNPDEFYGEKEQALLEHINRLGIGPQGMGGRITALAVRIRPYATHIAGLPCVVNMSCHVTRHASGEL